MGVKKNIKSRNSLPLLFSLGIAVVFGILKNLEIIRLDCTVQYLNPWQHSLSCTLLSLIQYVLVFLISFAILRLIFKKNN